VRASCALVVSVLCAGCFGGPAGAPQTTTRAHLGVTATFPAAWSVTWRPCHNCADPRGIFESTSYRTARHGRSLVCNGVPAGQVVLSVDEVLVGGFAGQPAPPRTDYPPRPRSFRIARLGRGQVYERCDVPGARLFRFRDSGRLLYAWAVFGPHPSDAVRAQAEDVLNSLRIAPLR
jgi:hypothetical protein